MAKTPILWTEGALQLYAQSESSSAGIQALKVILKALDFDQEVAQKLIEAGTSKESTASIQNYIASSVFNREQSRRSLFALNPDVFVEFWFASENRRYTEVMSYSVCQNSLEVWARASVSVTWWPVNFKNYEDAKSFAIKYLDLVLKALAKKPAVA